VIKVIRNTLLLTSFFFSSMVTANSNGGMITFRGAIVEGSCEVIQSENKLTGNCSGTDNPEKLVHYNDINKMGIRKPHPLPDDKGYMYIDSIDKKNKIGFLYVVYK